MQADFLVYILAFLAVLGILVTFHEFGHYIIARWSGVQVVKFCVGFGRTLWSVQDKHGTEFAIAAIPFGGFVRMLDDRDPTQVGELKPGRVAYMELHPAWRIAIALGGAGGQFYSGGIGFLGTANCGHAHYCAYARYTRPRFSHRTSRSCRSG